MKFLVDNALSPVVAEGLRTAGHDAVHIRDLRLASAADPAVLELAAREQRCLISADTDFGAILSGRKASTPSVILFRGEGVHRPPHQVMLILTNLASIEEAVDEGSVIVIERSRIRVRKLPITGG